jgi:hypothetical protein
LVKGKPWSPEEEQQLRDLVDAKTSVDVIAVNLGRQPDAIVMKCKRLKLEVVVGRGYTTTTSIALPKELPCVEEALLMLAGALKAACKPGLDKVEVQRLQVVATLARTYKDILVDYMDYRGLEAELLEERAENEENSKKSQGIQPK